MRYSLAAVFAFGLMLAGCTGGAMQTGIDLSQDVGAGLSRNISTDEMAQLQAQCKAAAPGLLAATAAAAPKDVSSVAVYGKAFCEQILSGKAYVDPKQQSSAWLDNLLKATQTAAQIAGFVLPLVL